MTQDQESFDIIAIFGPLRLRNRKLIKELAKGPQEVTLCDPQNLQALLGGSGALYKLFVPEESEEWRKAVKYTTHKAACRGH